MLGIDIAAWMASVVALGGAASGELAGHVPMLDPGPIASVLALVVGAAVLWRGHRSDSATRA
jgi:hypothetical protein